MKRTRRLWTYADDAAVARGARAGRTAAAIAAEIGRSEAAVKHRIRRLRLAAVGAPPRAWSAAEIALAQRLWAEGVSLRQIAAAVGRSYHAARQKVIVQGAAEDEDGGSRAERTCLRCGEGFDSAGPGNRVCEGCKKSAVWRTGADFETPTLAAAVRGAA